MGQERRFAAAAVMASACLALSWSPAIAIAHEAEGAEVQTVVQSDNGLPKTTEFHKLTGAITSGDTLTLVSTTTTDSALRIVHISKGNSKVDRCKVGKADDKLAPIDCTMKEHKGTGAHTWTVQAVEGGYTLQTQTEGKGYLNINNDGVVVGVDPQTLTISKLEDGSYSIGREVEGTMRYLSYGESGWAASDTAYSVMLYHKVEVSPQIVPNEKPAPGVTQDQPFPVGAGGSTNFRIPALITLNDGTLLAATDARWNTGADACGLDTIISRSTDGGKTWSYSFANYFNDSTNVANNKATAFIDPVLVQDNDGTIHLMVDLWPGGVALNSALNTMPVKASGYVEIDGKQRLVLYKETTPYKQNIAGAAEGKGYSHYIGDFDASGFAPVINSETKATDRYVDRDYYLYDAQKRPEYCPQLGSSDYVQQNVFFYNADLHVVSTSYLWMVSSTDGGQTWSDPQMLNEYVRTGLEKNDSFYGVGPGRGLTMENGRILLPCYTWNWGQGDGNSNVIYSDDGGKTWARGESLKKQTSESTVVEADGRLYMFARHGVWAVSNDGGETWTDEKRLPGGNLDLHDSCQIDAMVYSEKIDGKTAILLAGPTNGRTNGAIFVGLVQDDGSIDWAYRYAVTTGGAAYGYSCLTELEDGSIGLLYEYGNGVQLKYENIAIDDIAADAQIGNERKVSVPLYGQVELTVDGVLGGFDNVDRNVLGIDVKDNGDGASTVTFTGKREGTVEFTDPTSRIEYTVVVAPKQLVEVVVEPGETQAVKALGDKVTHEPDADIATVELASQNLSEVYGEAPGSLGTDGTFTGDAIPMSDTLFTFTADGENWTISGTTQDGKTSYLKIVADQTGYPGHDQPSAIQLKPQDNGGFKLYDTASKKHLHFWRDGKNRFDHCGSNSCKDDILELYRPAKEGEDTSASPILGFVKVADKSEVVDGGSYLIVATVGEEHFALNPSLSTTSQYEHVVKVTPDRVGRALNVTGVAPGTTDAAVGDTVYRITVAGYLAPTFTWSEDYSKATATFGRSDGGEPIVLDASVTSETTDATCTEDGKTVYTATVEFEGKTYTDVKTVELSKTDHAYGEPSFEWAKDYASCTAHMTCGACGDVLQLDCKVASERTEPTATQAGKVVYTAIAEHDGKTYTSVKDVLIPATGGNGGNVDESGGGESSNKPGDNTKPGSVLPQAGDPVLMTGLVSTIGVALATLGLRVRKRDE